MPLGTDCHNCRTLRTLVGIALGTDLMCHKDGCISSVLLLARELFVLLLLTQALFYILGEVSTQRTGMTCFVAGKLLFVALAALYDIAVQVPSWEKGQLGAVSLIVSFVLFRRSLVIRLPGKCLCSAAVIRKEVTIF